MQALPGPGAAHQSNTRATSAQQEYEHPAHTMISAFICASCEIASYRNRGGPPHAAPGRAASGTVASYPPGAPAAGPADAAGTCAG